MKQCVESILFLVVGMAVVMPGAAMAETWRCQSGTSWFEKGKITVVANIGKDLQSGTIIVAGMTHQAEYQVQGLDRRWDFGASSDGIVDYAFKIRPDGHGVYYDFTLVDVDKNGGKSTTASQKFVCRKSD